MSYEYYLNRITGQEAKRFDVDAPDEVLLEFLRQWKSDHLRGDHREILVTVQYIETEADKAYADNESWIDDEAN